MLSGLSRCRLAHHAIGARACIGRKFVIRQYLLLSCLLTGLQLHSRFFETEAILVSRYKIEVKEEPQFSGESFESRKERILASKGGLTLT